jgi:hypothetical protein
MGAVSIVLELLNKGKNYSKVWFSQAFDKDLATIGHIRKLAEATAEDLANAGGIQSVTGDQVDNTNPLTPIINVAAQGLANGTLPTGTDGYIMYYDSFDNKWKKTDIVFVDDINDIVGIGTNTPNTSSILDLSSTSKGLLVPRVTTTQKNAIISPAIGLIVMDTTLDIPMYYADNNGSPEWRNFIGSDPIVQNSLFVSQTNPNATDTRTGLSKYNLFKPFATIEAALSAAVSGDTIVLLSDCTITDTAGVVNNLFKQGVTLTDMGLGVSVSYSGSASGYIIDVLSIDALESFLQGNISFSATFGTATTTGRESGIIKIVGCKTTTTDSSITLNCGNLYSNKSHIYIDQSKNITVNFKNCIRTAVTYGAYNIFLFANNVNITIIGNSFYDKYGNSYFNLYDAGNTNSSIKINYVYGAIFGYEYEIDLVESNGIHVAEPVLTVGNSVIKRINNSGSRVGVTPIDNFVYVGYINQTGNNYSVGFADQFANTIKSDYIYNSNTVAIYNAGGNFNTELTVDCPLIVCNSANGVIYNQSATLEYLNLLRDTKITNILDNSTGVGIKNNVNASSRFIIRNYGNLIINLTNGSALPIEHSAINKSNIYLLNIGNIYSASSQKAGANAYSLVIDMDNAGFTYPFSGIVFRYATFGGIFSTTLNSANAVTAVTDILAFINGITGTFFGIDYSTTATNPSANNINIAGTTNGLGFSITINSATNGQTLTMTDYSVLGLIAGGGNIVDNLGTDFLANL